MLLEKRLRSGKLGQLRKQVNQKYIFRVTVEIIMCFLWCGFVNLRKEGNVRENVVAHDLYRVQANGELLILYGQKLFIKGNRNILKKL